MEIKPLLISPKGRKNEILLAILTINLKESP
jgi:hypothetical protein